MILVSACLAGMHCRYDGKAVPVEKVIELVSKGKAIPVCPEQLGGLPTPRVPSEFDQDPSLVFAGKIRIYDLDGYDRTEKFILGAEETLRIAKLYKIETAILKKNSPSCGVDGLTTFLLRKESIKLSWPV